MLGPHLDVGAAVEQQDDGRLTLTAVDGQRVVLRNNANLPDKDLAYFPEGSEHFADYVEAVEWAQRAWQLLHRWEIEHAHGQIGDPAVPTLLKALEDGDPVVTEIGFVSLLVAGLGALAGSLVYLAVRIARGRA